jgi:hypothetical protein
VNVDYIVNSLLERDLIAITGRAETPGRPILYGTTDTFLKILGLNSVNDLPKLKEINEILQNEKIEGITEADIDLFNSVNQNFVPANAETTGEVQEEMKFDEGGNAIVYENPVEGNDELVEDPDAPGITSQDNSVNIPDINIEELDIKSTIEIDKNLEEDKESD